MERVQQLLKAKVFLEMLAGSMDPTTQESFESEVLQKKEIKDMLLFVSSVLDDLIRNNGEVIQLSKPMSFQVDKLNKNKIILSDEPIQLSGLMTRINKQIDTKCMRKLGASKISKWLVEQGYLADEKISVVREVSQLTITDSAESFGIVMDNKVDEKTGEISPRILLTRKAQEFIVENLETILGEEVENIPNDASEKSNNSMQGVLWTKEEEDKLITEYKEEKLSIDEIAELHNRKNGGIRARLKKLGLIE